MEQDVSGVVLVKAEAGSDETGRLGGWALNEANRLNQPHKLQGLQGLHAAGGVQRDTPGSQIGDGKGVRCTRGWFPIGAVSIPCRYRWGTQERWHMADGKWQREGVGGMDRGALPGIVAGELTESAGEVIHSQQLERFRS
jgi:hypothetical protein